MESIDDLLNQLKSEYEEKDKPKPQQKQPPPQEKKSPQLPPIPKRQVQVSWQSNNIYPSAAEYSLLDEIKSEFSEKDRQEEVKRQQKIKEEQARQERIQQQQRQALEKEAVAWLKKLNPRSEEGLWFEEFSYSYPSKLEAAIDYLQALKETKS